MTLAKPTLRFQTGVSSEEIKAKKRMKVGVSDPSPNSDEGGRTDDIEADSFAIYNDSVVK